MKLAKYKACICEGSAESAIIDILVDNDLLNFSREEMLDVYKHAVEEKYRFFSFGDAMLIL